MLKLIATPPLPGYAPANIKKDLEVKAWWPSFVNELSDADRKKENWCVMNNCESSIGLLSEEKK